MEDPFWELGSYNIIEIFAMELLENDSGTSFHDLSGVFLVMYVVDLNVLG
jgi:hypothetical protein